MAGGGIKINNNSIRGGADGATFTPHYDEATGYISWTNNKNYPNPEPMKVKGKDGKDGVNGTNGKNGENGATGAKIIGQYLSGTDENGGNIYTQIFDDGTTAHFTAPKGEKGDDGEDAFVEIVQSTGYSQGAVMSQKAVTDRFDDINSSINEITVELDDKFSKRQISQNLGNSETKVTSQKGVTQFIELLETRIENTKTELNNMDLTLLRLLDEKLDIHDIVFSLGNDDDKVMSQSAVTRELGFTNMRLEEVKEKANNSISKSQITQETGDSEVRIMSQKAVTDALPRLQYAKTERLPDHTSSLGMNAIGGLVGGQTYVVRVYRKPNFVDAPVTIRVETQIYGGETILLIENNTDETITARFTVPDTVVVATGHLFYGDGGTATHEFYLDTEHNEFLKELEIVQETGSANDKIMSQRATTEKLNEKVNEDIFREELDKKADSSEVITLEKRVTNLEGATLATTIDDTIAYRKTVPNGVAKYALVDSVGGMSYKSNNLQYYPYSQTTLTYNGITFTDNGDGSITLNGTATDNSFIQLSSIGKYITLQAGTYIVSGGISNDVFLQVKNVDTDANIITEHGTGKTFTLTETTKIRINIYVRTGVTVSNVTIYPMLNSGSTALPYEPYFSGLRHSKVTELVSDGANFAKTINGTYTLNDYYSATLNNGHVRIDRKASPNAAECSSLLMIPYTQTYLPAGTYTMKCNNVAQKDISCAFYVFDVNGATITSGASLQVSRSFTLSAPATIKWGIYSQASTGYEEDGYLECDVMINAGSTVASYKPYVGTLGTLEIPEEVRNLCEGYGHGAITTINGVVQDTAYNAIEFASGIVKYRQNVTDEVTLTGKNSWSFHKESENYISFSASKIYLTPKMETTANAPIMCPNFDVRYWADLALDREFLWYYTSTIGICVSKTKLEAYGELTDDESKRNAFKAWLNDNPVTVIYKLANPIETDITEYFTKDNFIEVEGGGTITAVNEYATAVPTAVAYITKL